MKKLLIVLFVVLLVGAGYWFFLPETEAPEIPQNNAVTETKDGEILSLIVEPSSSEGGWIMYTDGAKAILMGKNLAGVKIKTMPTGTGMGELYPDGVEMGEMTMRSETDSIQVWELEMRTAITATDMWAEALDDKGVLIMSDNLGSVGYEQ